MSYSSLDKQRELERELNLRHRVYPRWVEAGKMKLDMAQRQIAIMEAIAADYRELAKKERLL